MFRSGRRGRRASQAPQGVLVVENVPFRTTATLKATGNAAGNVDLWPVAREIEVRMRELGRPEPTLFRPPVTGVGPGRHPHTYTWHWSGDEHEWLMAAAEDVLHTNPKYHGIGMDIAVQGRRAEVLAAPPPAPEPTLEDLERAAGLED